VDEIELVGLDVGTTTLRGLRVRARRVASPVSGAPELAAVRVAARLPTQLTPYCDEDLDGARILATVDAWLAGAAPADGGGVLLTGLAARAPSAAAIAEALRIRVGDGVVLAASDPRLEAWVAFMGSARALSEEQPDRWVVNLDVGGGTTNVAWARDGTVLATASLYVGARHVRIEPGARRILGASPEAQRLCAEAGLSLERGRPIAPAAVDALVSRQVRALEDVVLHGAQAQALRVWPWLAQALPRASRSAACETPLVTISGGVGELLRALRRGTQAERLEPLGDLGWELARAIGASPVLAAGPSAASGAGQSTVWGLVLHATELAGATVYVGRPDLVPRRDVPVVARVPGAATEDELVGALELARAAAAGAAIVIDGLSATVEEVRPLGERLAGALRRTRWPADRPLVVLVGENVGQALGQYATAWGRRPAPLVVLDQVRFREARLVTVGRPMRGLVPVAFSGLLEGPGD
jgi:ethanolamine utilization protein EutA